jgi:hypothetical protein
MVRVKQDLAEKELIARRLKSEVNQKTKELNDLEKYYLQKSAVGSGQAESRVLVDEISHLIEMLQEGEKREGERLSSIKRQHNAVKIIEKELLERGIGESELEAIKKRCII